MKTDRVLGAHDLRERLQLEVARWHPTCVGQTRRVGSGVVERRIRISSTLPVSYRPELERIVFFNPRQDQVTVPLVASLRRYGVPETVETNQCLRFKVGAFGEVQSLFAFDDAERVPRLAGVVMFTRESTQSMLLLHLAIHESYTHGGMHASAGVTAQLLTTVRRLSLRIRGVETLRMLYPRETQLFLRQHRAPTS